MRKLLASIALGPAAFGRLGVSHAEEAAVAALWRVRRRC